MPSSPDTSEGAHTFLHHPTTSNVTTNIDSLVDVFLGEKSEIAYYVEEMRRRHLMIVLNQGQEFLLVPRKLSGTRCPFWKSEEQQCSNPMDTRAVCYNTGWVGGYRPPLLIRVVVPPTSQNSVAYESGVRKEFPVRPWTVHAPMIRNRDMMIDKWTGDRFEVMDYDVTRFRGLPMHQSFSLRALTRDKEHFAYSVNIAGLT